MAAQPPPSKSAFRIGDFVRQKYSTIRESLGISNKLADNTTWLDLGVALRALHESPGLFPSLQSAVDVLTSCLDVLEASSRNRKEYQELASELTRLSQLLMQHTTGTRSIRMSDSIANIIRSVEEQAKHIQKKCDRGEGRRFLEARDDEEDLYQSYRRIEVLFRQLQTDAVLSALSLVEEQTINARLEGLAPAKLANYNSKLSIEVSRRTCTEDTRTEVLSGLDDWSYNPEGANVYWMNGMAGTGKTTIACSFSKQLEDRKQLAASFFCTRTTAECRDITRIVPTIAYQLARYSIPFRSAVCEALGNDPDIGSKTVQTQFELLLREPLVQVKAAMPNNLVVVIDALDECDDKYGTKLILDMLFQFAIDLPLKFFVTSRPEPEISKRMRSENESTRSVMYLHDIEESVVQADIMRYLREELLSISPTPTELKQLVQRSGKLFIYAATLVRYIRPTLDPRQRLESVLAMTSHSTLMHTEIDKLYAAILTEVFDSTILEPTEIADIRRALWTVLCVQEPLSIDTLAQLTGLEQSRMLSMLQPVQSVVQFSDDSGVVSTLHASFPDFMLDEARSGRFFCNAVEHHLLLAQTSFTIMKDQLHFNICNIESSFFPDEEVEELQERIHQMISPALFYSCCYWGHHIQSTTGSLLLSNVMQDFLSTQLLFWMEVINLRNAMNVGLETLFKARWWLKLRAGSPELQKLADDARDFVTIFAQNPVSQCSAHIYISALPLCPKSSLVHKLYQGRVRGIINLTGGFTQSRETVALARWNTQSGVYSIAHSPDGNYVAAGCADGTIWVHNAHNGTLLAGPLEHEHGSCVRSLAFSPCGTRVVSGSDDSTIRIWGVPDGALVNGPLKGHTSPVYSVTFSPNGSHFASGSSDNTIQVWNSDGGVTSIGPLTGHDGVVSVAYSPDGTRIASGYNDGKIRVWNPNDGKPIANPLEGHTYCVRSVTFSPDGTNIASGSDDGTIRVWRSKDGSLVAGPFEGHAYGINSVVYSPNGVHIAFGADDCTARVLNANDGVLIAGPFRGHTSRIWSIAYSPDSTRLVSGSEDSTLRVWRTHGENSVSAMSQLYTSNVSSVTYSPNGALIASCFDDNTIRMWSPETGSLVAGPIPSLSRSCVFGSTPFSPDGESVVSVHPYNDILISNAQDPTTTVGPFIGHTDEVTSVTFSPDGRYIVSASHDHSIRVWGARDSQLASKVLQGHTGSVLSVACSPNGRHIVSGSRDNTIRVWKMPSDEGNHSNTDGTEELISQGHEPPLDLRQWQIRSDGWVTDDMTRRLFWVPAEMADIWPSPQNALVISPHGSLKVDYSGVLIGERWTECFISD